MARLIHPTWTSLWLANGLLALGMVGGTLRLGAAADPPDAGASARMAQRILLRHCVECHRGPEPAAGLSLVRSPGTTPDDRRTASLLPEKRLGAELLRRVRLPGAAEDAMPPRGERLREDEVASLERWVAEGAPAESTLSAVDTWSFTPLRRPRLPTVQRRGWPRQALDLPVLAGLEAVGLEPSPEAPRAALLRRLTLDLTGLPPTVEEVDDFLADEGPDAWERVVDRLLAADQLGVRWARPWLDYARYADSHGFQRDDLRDVWAYRDWVVDALNADLPFDQFTIEQLAGDLLPQSTIGQRIATGFNRQAPCNVEAGSDPEETRVNQVHDRVQTLGAVWLGVTLECCQCHDHKYDPFTMRDYYGLFAIFNNTVQEADRADPAVPGSIRFLGHAIEVASGREVSGAGARRAKAPGKEERAVTTQVMKELDAPRRTTIFGRGDFRSPGEAVEPAVPSVFPPANSAATPLNRLALAQWLMRDDQPRVARVTVNRWWAELMGRGLVATLEDFGTRSEPPTHPELLDLLADDLRASGWSMKASLRSIVTSATYRQSARITTDAWQHDPTNRWWGRSLRTRLEAEAIRDNALAVAGLLCRQRGGPPIRPYQPAGWWDKVGGEKYNYELSAGGERYRRGLYVVWKRAAPFPSFQTFDAPNRLTCRLQRPRTNTPLQALTLLNDPVYVEAALGLAGRLLREMPEADDGARLTYGWRLAVGRPPSADELHVLDELLTEQRAVVRQTPGEATRLVGMAERPAGVPAAELAAWYVVAATLLNLDETVTRP